MNGGDILARGAKSAQFPASSGNVSQEKWDSIFGVGTEEKSNDAGTGTEFSEQNPQ